MPLYCSLKVVKIAKKKISFKIVLYQKLLNEWVAWYVNSSLIRLLTNY